MIKPVALGAAALLLFINAPMGRAVEPIPAARPLPSSKIRPEAMAAYDRAILKYESGDLPGALADFNGAIALQADFAAAYVNRANIKDDQGDPQGALVDYAKAVNLDKQNPNAYLNRGLTYFRLDRYGEAIADFQKSIALRPDYAPAHRSLGVAKYASTGDTATKQAGIADVRKAAELYRQQGQETKALEIEAIVQQMEAAL
jgi:tetratricopeptide (TPR) repeat protein